ncbi:hypothetical protein [Frigoriglobus tundricola]|uniref:DUF3365 domain-containing protein n=1 Tax=Frigoriglobus tundricola TaxID=2774151 RepID=A0A6M5YV33_9BACT|nr:hypothetical protein [Frigoriglobus tundricola]QJW97905.1 hypothetical protein FTUN_5485 [Frigoriglobus tundricola]
MFFKSLPVALIVLGTAHFAARPYPHPLRWGWFLVCGVVAGSVGGPVVTGMFVLLLVALLLWSHFRQRVRTFLPLSAVAVAIPYGLVGWDAHEQQTAHDRFRQAYPFESIADRLPEPRAALHTPLTDGAVVKLDKLEEAVQDEANKTSRTYQLRRLHSQSVRTFVNNPGFGRTRMGSNRMTEESFRGRSGRSEAPGQPGSPSIWGHEDPFELMPSKDREELGEMHVGGTLDFVNPWGWGYVKSRDRVAGFLPHRFSKVPEVKTWRVQRIELVGLLKHPEPVVYLSDRLPAMAELVNAPTRPLDAFEGAGLSAVRAGGDGFAAHRGAVVRFVGAIRSAKQCVECHGGQRGDLLGAFSYTLHRDAMRP